MLGFLVKFFYMHFLKVNQFFHRIYTFLLCVLIIGNPLIFSSYTRSVFEVNKLLLLRGVSLLLLAFWGFKKLLDYYHNRQADLKDSYEILGIRWKRVGLEIPSLLYVIVTLITCVFSTNVWLAIIGSYDRWEGIFTVLNYVVLVFFVAKLVVKRSHFFVILFCLVLASMLSGLYGVLQSLGFDVMRWSADPTFRVFACINNPVHFCAFMGMVIPFVLALYLYFYHHANTILVKQKTIVFLGRSFVKSHLSFVFVSLFVFSSFMMFLIDGLHEFFVAFFSYACLLYAAYVLYYFRIFKNQNVFLSFVGIFIFVSFVIFSISKVIMLLVFALMAFIYLIDAIFDKNVFLMRFCYVALLLIFYVQILSYSRATFVGFNMFMPFFFILLSKCMLHLTNIKKIFFISSVFLFFVFFALFFMFNIYSYGTLFKVLFYVGLALFMIIFYKFNKDTLPIGTYSLLSGLFFTFCFSFFHLSALLKVIVSSMALFLILLIINKTRSLLFNSFLFLLPCFFIFCQSMHLSYFYLVVSAFILFSLVYIGFKMNDSFLMFDYKVIYRLLGAFYFVLLFFSLPMLKQSLFDFLYNFQLWYVSFYLIFTFLISSAFLSLVFPIFTQFKRFYFCITIFFVFMILWLNFGLSQSVFKSIDSKAFRSSFSNRSEQLLDKERTQKNSRFYMWTSVPKWFMDYPIFGSGLDTIKFLYPLYRDPRYGIYEGAHNFTPDRLHNEYLNTLVTKGLIGFIVYYFMYIGGFYLLLIKFMGAHFGSWKQYFYVASFVSVGVYLGQVLFNFGVLPTLVLFYMVIGFALSLFYMGNDKELS